MEKKLSAATKRAIERGYFDNDSTWFAKFRYTTLKGDLAKEVGVVRRDPSRVIEVEGLYYVWYTKSAGETYGIFTDRTDLKTWKWDLAEVWCAVSEDGYEWKEIGCAVTMGEEGSYDDRSVFTPEILVHEEKYYLTYQCVKAPYQYRTQNTIGMAVAESPRGPWRKLEAPILTASDTGEWEGEDDNRFKAKDKGDFDSLKVHDPCLMFYNNQFYLYYKGERKGEEMYMGGREIRWGVAIAEHIEGPYIKSEYNPITNSGHEVCVWEYDGGIAAMLTSDGMEKNTIQYAKDGINFEIKGSVSRLEHIPHAAGPLTITSEACETPLDGLKWGLHMVADDWDYIERFDLDTRDKDNTKNKVAEAKQYYK